MINFLCTSPYPKMKGTDAVYNELATLQKEFDGNIKSLYPFKKPSSKFPVILLGSHNFRKIKATERHSKINHIYGSALFNMLAIRQLKKPTIYSLVAGISSPDALPSIKYLNRFKAIVVSNDRDYKILSNKGLNNVSLIRTSIKVEQFTKEKSPLNKTLNLMMASAPWESKQFKSKGIHIILSTLQKIKDVHFTFLWRDILATEMKKLIAQYGVQDKITLIDRKVNPNDYLKQNHGTVLLADNPGLVKASPHSLLESLCAGKPIILTKEIPLSDYVEQKRVGLILNEFTSESLQKLIKQFRAQYLPLSQNAYALPNHEFSKDQFISQYQKLYETVLK